MKPPKYFLSSDNALGSSAGDVDDGLALLHFVARKIEFESLFSVFGNTDALSSMKNSNLLFESFGDPSRMALGAGAPGDTTGDYKTAFSGIPATTKIEMIELGPLTNLANLVAKSSSSERQKISCVRIMGTTLGSRGRWPPFWPFEYNLTKDRRATVAVFKSELPLLIFPLDVAKKFRVHLRELVLADVRSTMWLSDRAQRWFRRNRRLYFRKSVIAWDVLIAIHVTHPHLFFVEERKVDVDSRGVVNYGSGRSVQVVVDFDSEQVRQEFRRSLEGLRLTESDQ